MFTDPTQPASSSSESSDGSSTNRLARIRALVARGEYVVDLERLAKAILGSGALRSAS